MQSSCFSLRLCVTMAAVLQLSAERGLAGVRVIERPKARLSYWDLIPTEIAPQLRGNPSHPLSFRREDGLRIPAISGDGTTVMGSLEGPAGSQPALWRGTNISLLPMAAGTTVGFAVGSDFNAKKFWGNFIVEPYSHCPGPAYTICYWDTNGALFYLGSNTTALCTAVSADGNTAVGRVEWCNQDGFAWDAFAAGGVLRFLPRGPDPISTAEGVNRDGTRIVGQRQTDSAPYTFLPTVWTQTSFYYLPLPPGSDTSGRATGCSADGNVIFGLVSYYDEFQILREHTVAWINGVLNTIETDDIPRWVPMAASGDGATIVGYLEYTGFGDRGIIWDKERGPRFLDELLVNAYGFDFGAPPGPGIGMPRPTGISDDGSIIVGWGPNQDPAGQYCMVQLLDRQELRARIDHTNIIISWMPALGGMNLESRTADSTVWETLLTLDGTRGSYTNSISGPSKFFRLTAR